MFGELTFIDQEESFYSILRLLTLSRETIFIEVDILCANRF